MSSTQFLCFVVSSLASVQRRSVQTDYQFVNLDALNVPLILWTLWVGDDAIEESTVHGPRKAHLDRLDDVDIEHRHVTLSNLHAVNISSDPIHPEITAQHLSGIHKGDYMRSYLMYHFGGAYTDIEGGISLGWARFFDDFRSDAWVYGAREPTRGGVACHPQKLPRLRMHGNCAPIKNSYKMLLHNQAYIFRAHSPLAREWLDENNRQLDDLAESLRLHPAPTRGRCCLDEDPKGYPIRWAELHGEVFHPLSLKYTNRIQASKIGFWPGPPPKKKRWIFW